MPSLSDYLRSSIWARGLSAEALDRVCAESFERAAPAGGYVCRRGEPVEHWTGIVEGLVKICADGPDGRTMTFTEISRGGWFGEGSLLKSDLRKYDAVALRPSHMALMPRTTFTWLLDSSIAFNRFLLNQLNERLAQFMATVEYDRLLAPEARIARCLAMLFNPHLYPGLEGRLHLSQEEIGFLSGVSRQRANQALRVLEDAGLLKVEYGSVTALDVQGLMRFDQ